ncbi:uncharacterized protein C2orf72 homolog [Hylobates moloch]|uniref:uncharacterized protein C2orf72 homolog n=1 Tax=Hylobates moloch TaxID=81572 RepID=UPI0013F23900|nr:uncharacterized protein C2orf72 homolog [Hylobates moloch]
MPKVQVKLRYLTPIRTPTGTEICIPGALMGTSLGLVEEETRSQHIGEQACSTSGAPSACQPQFQVSSPSSHLSLFPPWVLGAPPISFPSEVFLTLKIFLPPPGSPGSQKVSLGPAFLVAPKSNILRKKSKKDAVAPGLRLLEALLRAVFGRQAGGPVQAAAYCPGLPASCLAVQAAACRALQAAGAGQPVEGAWERPGLPGLLACFSWGPWSQRKNQDVAACRSPAQEDFQEPEEELALTAIFPNGDCEDLGRGSKACDGVVHTPAEPTGDSR